MKHLIAFIMLAVSLSASAFDNLDTLFADICKMNGADSARVDFTGGWPKNGAKFGFAMMRGEGKGHTKGLKVGAPVADIAVADSILDIFTSMDNWGRSDWYRTCSDENARVVYSIYFNEMSDSLYMIRVTFEDEPSLPYDWPFRTRYDAADSTQSVSIVPMPQIATDFTEALVRLYEEVKYNFVFYPSIANRWERAYKRNLAAMRQTEDDYEKFRILQRMVALCGDGHTFVYLNTDELENPVRSPFTTVLLADGLYVRSVESREMMDAGMRRGQKIVAVNGGSPAAWADKELKPYVCSSTPQWTEHVIYDGYNFSLTRKGSKMDLTLENPDGSRITLPHTVNDPKWDSSLAIYPQLGFTVLDHNIGLLTIPHFQNTQTTEFFDSVFPAICNTDALIIDLRGNGGGNSGFANYIASHLIDKPISTAAWTTRIYKPAFASWGQEEDTYQSLQGSLMPIADATPYSRPVVLLTDRGTFSAAEDFTALLKSAGRVTQIGTVTGGSTGNGVRPSLTSNGTITANICSKHDLAPDGTEFVGIGLIPDITVEENAASYFDPVKDDVIEAAIRHLTAK